MDLVSIPFYSPSFPSSHFIFRFSMRDHPRLRAGEPPAWKSPVERVCARKTPKSRWGDTLGQGVSCAAARGSSSCRKKKRPGLQGPGRQGCRALIGVQDLRWHGVGQREMRGHHGSLLLRACSSSPSSSQPAFHPDVSGLCRVWGGIGLALQGFLVGFFFSPQPFAAPLMFCLRHHGSPGAPGLDPKAPVACPEAASSHPLPPHPLSRAGWSPPTPTTLPGIAAGPRSQEAGPPPHPTAPFN